jgi:type IV pilus assembly protein PilY1
MRFGGSCGNCVSGVNNGAPPMTVTADFNSNGTTTDVGDTRTFFSAYFVLDITDPEQDPKLLWVFTDSGLGLTTGAPAVVRVNPLGDTKTDNTNANWVVIFGSGTTGYTGNSTQLAKFFAVDLVTGPTYNAGTGAFTGPAYWACSVGGVCDGNSFLGDIITVDSNLDYRVDVIYAGSTMTNSSSPPAYIGKMYHLATGAMSSTGTPTNLSTWGIASATSSRIPTVLLATFTCGPSPCTGSTLVGPITSGASVSGDNNNNIWVFFGTGRFFSQSDKSNVDPQYYFGVKDPVANTTSCTESTTTSCQKNNLLDVSNVSVCVPGVGTCTTTNQVTGIAGITDYSSLVNKITNATTPALNMDGWFITFPTAGERSLSRSIVLGGMVFFTTFTPDDDICSAGGNGNLYSLYYLTGGAYSQSTIGTSPIGTNENINRSLSLGNGLPSQMAVQIGAEGTGVAGGASTAGCTGRLTGYIQSSTGVLGQFCGQTALGPWSRLISWREL